MAHAPPGAARRLTFAGSCRELASAPDAFSKMRGAVFVSCAAVRSV